MGGDLCDFGPGPRTVPTLPRAKVGNIKGIMGELLFARGFAYQVETLDGGGRV